MTQKIHSSAIVSPNAKIGSNVEIGPFCIIGNEVKIGDNTILKSHVVIEGDTLIGKNNIIFPFAIIGAAPQDLKFKGEKSRVIIGDNNTIREHATIHLGTEDGVMETKIGNNCLLMVGAHVAHDCIVGDHVILANNASIAGHVEVGERAILGGFSVAHQFVKIGAGAMVGGMSAVDHNVIPYGTVIGERACLAGLNLVGLKRRNFSREDINELRSFFKKLFTENGSNIPARSEELQKEFNGSLVAQVASFIKLETSRPICQLKQSKQS